MAESGHLWTRIVSVIAATVIALACGTQYAYSAWAPQFAERMKLSSTQSNLIGTIGNLGMYAAGVPVGILVDTKGPKPGVILGGICLGVGFLALRQSFESGAGSVPLAVLCFFQFLTGIGSPAAFSSSVKTSAVNWPTHRGTATAMPMSAFGLGAFFFTTISWFAFPDDTSDFLLLLSIGCFVMCMGSVVFLRIVPEPTTYSAIPSDDGRDSNRLRRQKSEDGTSTRRASGEPGTQTTSLKGLPQDQEDDSGAPAKDTDETSSLLSLSSIPGDLGPAQEESKSHIAHDTHLDLRGLAMVRTLDFWLLFSQLGLLTGIGLMTINNIGSDAKALWIHYDDSVSHDFVQERQLMHVQIYSLSSFCGRVLSGVGSDLIVRRLHASRYWCVLISSCIFCVAQACGARIEKPELLVFVSGLTGLAYGFHFGVYPSLVADSFGIGGLSQNWGAMTLSAIVGGNIFNLLYGRIFDAHSIIKDDGSRVCLEGLQCYSHAYWITFGGSLIGMTLALISIRHDHKKKWRARKGYREFDREA